MLQKYRRLTTDWRKEAKKDFSGFLKTKMSFSGFPEETDRVNQTQGAVPRKVTDHNRQLDRAKKHASDQNQM